MAVASDGRLAAIDSSSGTAEIAVGSDTGEVANIDSSALTVAVCVASNVAAVMVLISGCTSSAAAAVMVIMASGRIYPATDSSSSAAEIAAGTGEVENVDSSAANVAVCVASGAARAVSVRTISKSTL